MREKSIDFILCCSNQECVDKCVACINNLIIPEGYSIDIIGASEANSIAEAYNALMIESDAKYKVYLYENIYITDREFLIKAIDEIESDSGIGMLGVLGQNNYIESEIGEWNCGTISIVNNTRAEKIDLNNHLQKEVDILNGCLLMTAVDVGWESITGDKNGYFDLAHSKKMRAAGYSLRVFNTENPVCLYEAGKSLYDRYDVYTTDRGCKYVLPIKSLKKPLVSVILCVYNGENFVGKTIDSIITQTYRNLQIIIVDDCSTDSSRSIIEDYAKKDSRIETIYLEKNANVCNAANVAYKHCRGQYVASIGHDDIWNEEKIERQVDFMETNRDISVCFSLCDIINQYDENINRTEGRMMFDIFSQTNHSRNEWIDILFYGNNCFCAPSSLIRMECIEGELYKYSLVQLQDYDLWLSMVAKGDVYIIQDRLLKYRMFIGQEQNLSSVTKEKNNRLWHENGYLKKKFIQDLPDDIFVELFKNRLINKNACRHSEILCEKAFVLKTIKCCRCYDMFMELIDKDETREILEKQYDFDLKAFYEFSLTSMNFDSELMYRVLELSKQIECMSSKKN